jgi:hypothetical protein
VFSAPLIPEVGISRAATVLVAGVVLGLDAERPLARLVGEAETRACARLNSLTVAQPGGQIAWGLSRVGPAFDGAVISGVRSARPPLTVEAAGIADSVERGCPEALRPRPLHAEGVRLAGEGDDHGIAGETLALVAGDRERVLVGTLDPMPARVRGAVRVASDVEHLARCVAEREDEPASMIEGVAEGKARRLLPPVRRHRGR